MEKALGVLLMVLFGISGLVAAALAWLIPSLNLDKTMATLAGVIGVGFAVFQGLRFRHYGHATSEPIKVATEDKT